MEEIVFEIKSLLNFKLDLVRYPELTSKNRWVQKGLDLLKGHFPKILLYLSKQHIISVLHEHDVIIKTDKKIKKKRIRSLFKYWIKKEKAERLFLLIIEGLLIPFTAVLALLPGPNFFFYIPALLFYYHFRSYRGLQKIDLKKMQFTILADSD